MASRARRSGPSLPVCSSGAGVGAAPGSAGTVSEGCAHSGPAKAASPNAAIHRSVVRRLPVFDLRDCTWRVPIVELKRERLARYELAVRHLRTETRAANVA